MSQMMRFVMVAALATLAGCYKAELTNFTAGGSPGAEVKVWNDALLVGIIPLSDVDVTEKCGDKGVWKVETKVSVLAAIVSGLTFNLYSPNNIVITCKG